MTSAEISTSATPIRVDRRAGQIYLLIAICFPLTWIGGAVVQLWSMYPGLMITEALFILAPPIGYAWLKGLPAAEALGWHKVSAGTALVGALLGITSCGPALCIALATYPILGPPPQIPFFEITTFGQLVTMWFVAALLPGICEETLFRGAIQGTLRRKGFARALIYTSLLFGVFHVNPWNFLPPVFLALVLGVLAERSGSIIPCMIAHAGINATAFTIGYLYHDDTNADALWLLGALSIAFVITFSIYLLRTRGRETMLPLLSRVPADLPRWVKWTAWGVASSGAALVVAAIIVARSLVGMYTAANEVTGADLHQGDSIIVLKQSSSRTELERGDLVAFRRDGRTVRVGRVTRREGDHVWVAGEPAELALDPQDIVGKVLQTLAAPRGLQTNPGQAKGG